MQGGNILQTIIDNKERIKYLGERYEDTGSYHLFKFKSKLRNIFGFHKCFLIEVYDDLDWIEFLKEGTKFDMYLRLPFHCRMVPINSQAEELSEILYDIYFRTEYKSDSNVWESVGKLLQGCKCKEEK